MNANTIDECTVKTVAKTAEILTTPEAVAVDCVRALAQLSRSSVMFEGLSWVEPEEQGYDLTRDIPEYRILKVKFAWAETECIAINENKKRRKIEVTDRYFSGEILDELLIKKEGQLYCKCRYSVAKLTSDLKAEGVEIGEGKNWTDRAPYFGPLGRDYKNVRIISDFDEVHRMLDTIRDKCKSDFIRTLNSNKWLNERIGAMKKSISLDISGSGNQVSLGNGTVTQQQTAAKGMFSKANIGDVDSSSHIETESFVSGILRHRKVLAVIFGIAGLLLAYVFWKGVDITGEKGDCKINIQTRR